MTNDSNISLSHLGTHVENLFSSLIFVTDIFGLVGNGVVIWLLGFSLKRNTFTIYILNLAVADFGVLLCTVPTCLKGFSIPVPNNVFSIALYLFTFMFCTSQCLLTAISIDRCVSVIFPIWHRCRCPPYLSTTVCALIWLLNFLFCGTEIIWNVKYFQLYQYSANAVLCFPLITVSTLTLFFKVCRKPKQHKRGKLFTVILLTLLFFFIVGFPFSVVLVSSFFNNSSIYLAYLMYYSSLGAALNSAINPLIYFLVGKKKRGQVGETIKAILQRLFKEEEEFPEEPVDG